MGRNNAPLMSSENPPFQQAGDSMDPRHGDVRGIAGGGQHGCLSCISVFRQAVVTVPAIRVHHRARSHDITDERQQTGAGSVWNMAHPHPAEPFGLFDLYGNHHHAFAHATATFAALLYATHQCFIHFDLARQRFAFGVHHRHSKTLQHRPCHTITGAQCALQGFSRHAILGRRHMPGSLKPSRQWGSRFVEDRSRSDRGLLAAGWTYKAVTALIPRGRNHSAGWADEPFRPAYPRQIGRTRLNIRKHAHEFSVGVRVIDIRKIL